MLKHISCLHLLCRDAFGCQSNLEKLMATKGILDDLLQTRILRPKASHDQGNIHLDLNRSKHQPSASTSGGGLQPASTL